MLADIADTRAYERERDSFRAHVIAVKRLRRVPLGQLISVVFESRDTIRFQIQEMARAERIGDDAGIQAELDVYNVLVPEPGQLSATLFLELTSDDETREWLPKLVGIERSLELRLGEGSAADVVPGVVEEQHAARLTRESTTSAVHYVRFDLSDEQVAAVAAGRVALAVDHPQYQAERVLGAATIAELLTDLRA